MVAFEALGFITGGVLLLQHALQSQCSPLLLSHRAAPLPQLPTNLTSIMTNITLNENPHSVALEISPFPVHVSYIDPFKFDEFMEVAYPKIKDDIREHGKDTRVEDSRWTLATSGVAVLFVEDVHYPGDLTYGMIDAALTELFFTFAFFNFRESNLKVYEDWGEKKLISRGYVAKTIRGPQGSTLVDPSDASSVAVTR